MESSVSPNAFPVPQWHRSRWGSLLSPGWDEGGMLNTPEGAVQEDGL